LKFLSIKLGPAVAGQLYPQVGRFRLPAVQSVSRRIAGGPKPPFVIEYGALGEHALPTLKFLYIELALAGE